MVVGAHDKERRVRVAQHTVAAVSWWLHTAPTNKFHTSLCSSCVLVVAHCTHQQVPHFIMFHV